MIQWVYYKQSFKNLINFMDEENKQPTSIQGGEIKVEARKVIKISKKKFKIIIIVAVIILLVIVLGALGIMRGLFGVGSYNARPMMNIAEDEGITTSIMNPLGSSEKGVSDYYQPNDWRGSQQPSISDTREFLKVNYSASIETRDVEKVTTDVKNIIKGADGRIDNISSSEKRGYISFVVAKSKFEAFKSEIENITHKKLFVENESSQNLLTQKQSIEEQTTNIVNTLANLKNQKDTLNAKHIQTVGTINKEIARIQKELTAVRTSIAITTDPTLLTSLRSQETSYVGQDATQRKKLNDENNSYVVQSQSLDNSISNYNNNLTNINKVDSQFTDNIETVNGTISVQWVSLWQIARIFSPIPPFLIIVILVILGWIYLRHKSYIPKVEFQ